jgi:hypothetical protein
MGVPWDLLRKLQGTGTLRQLQVLKRPPLVGGQKSEAIQEGARARELMTALGCFPISCRTSPQFVS